MVSSPPGRLRFLRFLRHGVGHEPGLCINVNGPRRTGERRGPGPDRNGGTGQAPIGDPATPRRGTGAMIRSERQHQG